MSGWTARVRLSRTLGNTLTKSPAVSLSGATLMGLCGFLLGWYAERCTTVLVAPLGLAIARPLLLDLYGLLSQRLRFATGQISGIPFIYTVDALRSESGAMTPSIVVLLGLSILEVLLALRGRESGLLRSDSAAPTDRRRGPRSRAPSAWPNAGRFRRSGRVGSPRAACRGRQRLRHWRRPMPR